MANGYPSSKGYLTDGHLVFRKRLTENEGRSEDRKAISDLKSCASFLDDRSTGFDGPGDAM